jgi:hypothetical protein
MVNAKRDYHIEYAKRVNEKDQTEEEVKTRFVLTAKKRIKNFIEELMKADGIDMIQPLGAYSCEIIIAKTFDEEEVTAELIEVLKRAQSGLIQPNKELVTP